MKQYAFLLLILPIIAGCSVTTQNSDGEGKTNTPLINITSSIKPTNIKTSEIIITPTDTSLTKTGFDQEAV